MTRLRLSPRMPRMDLLRAGLRRQEGAALVEFAISLGIFLAVTIGIVFLCVALFTYEYVDYASREAVRWASVRGADCYLSTQTMPGCTSAQGASITDIQNYVKSLDFPLINTDSSVLKVTPSWSQASTTVPVTWTPCGPGTVCNARGNQVQVTVTYTFNLGLSIPFVGPFTPTVSSSSQMVIAQ